MYRSSAQGIEAYGSRPIASCTQVPTSCIARAACPGAHSLPGNGHNGDYLKQVTFRQRHWTPALRAAGVEHRRVYDCRHAFATWAIAAGVQLFYLSRIMGTSITQIDATYGHLVPDSEDYLRNLLDTYDAEVLPLAVEHAL